MPWAGSVCRWSTAVRFASGLGRGLAERLGQHDRGFIDRGFSASRKHERIAGIFIHIGTETFRPTERGAPRHRGRFHHMPSTDFSRLSGWRLGAKSAIQSFRRVLLLVSVLALLLLSARLRALFWLIDWLTARRNNLRCPCLGRVSWLGRFVQRGAALLADCACRVFTDGARRLGDPSFNVSG